MKTTLILACAGKGCRAGFDKNKLLVQVKGLTTLERTLSVFYKSGLIDEYIVTASEQDFEQIKSLCPDTTKIVLGGSTRTQSVSNALKVTTGDVVLIHDGARPFVTKKMIGDCIECAKEFGGCIPTTPTPDTIVKTSDGNANYGSRGISNYGFQWMTVVNAGASGVPKHIMLGTPYSYIEKGYFKTIYMDGKSLGEVISSIEDRIAALEG